MHLETLVCISPTIRMSAKHWGESNYLFETIEHPFTLIKIYNQFVVYRQQALLQKLSVLDKVLKDMSAEESENKESDTKESKQWNLKNVEFLNFSYFFDKCEKKSQIWNPSFLFSYGKIKCYQWPLSVLYCISVCQK